jgi:hypothetical protein
LGLPVSFFKKKHHREERCIFVSFFYSYFILIMFLEWNDESEEGDAEES